MAARSTLGQLGAILAVAVVAGTVSNLSAGKERRLRWIADWQRVVVPSAAAPSPASPESPGPAPSTGAGTEAGTGARTGAEGAPGGESDGIEVHLDFVAAEQAKGTLFLDARPTHEYQDGHVPGARSFAVWESDVDDKIVALMSEVGFDQRIVVYCNGGHCTDSHGLRNKLLAAGWKDVRVYKEGFPDWKEHGKPVER